jgi:multiple sugar transport system substrate-binding protein
MSSGTSAPVSRRSILRAGGGLATLGAAMAFGQACSPGSVASDGTVTLDVLGWVYDPTLHRGLADQYRAQNPKVDPVLDFAQGDHFLERIIALFTSNAAPDVVFAHDNDIANFVDSGYIQPINGLAGEEEALADVIGFNREALDYKGKTWGIPYYGDVMAFIYNTDMVKRAGISDVPQTWDDVAEQARHIKQAGILQHPFVFPMDNTASRHWMAAIHGSGGNMFGDGNNPVFPDEDPTALNFLTWLVEAAKSEILDPSSLGLGTTSGKQAFQAGKAAFMTDAHYDMKAINDPKQSQVAGKCGQHLMPSLTDAGPHGTIGFSAAFCISAPTEHRDQAWDFIKFLGGPDANRQLFLRNGQAPAYKELQADPVVRKELEKWCDPDLTNKQTLLATRQKSFDVPWYAEWQVFHQQQVQRAVQGQVSPREALQTSADKARELNQP